MLRLIQLFLPVLFPSWRFFEAIGPSPRIEVRRDPEGQWSELWPLPPRLLARQYLGRLFFNAEWNRRLYLTSTALRYTVDPDTWVLSELKKGVANRLGEEVEVFEFRILFLAREGDQIGAFVEYESGSLQRSACQ